MEFRHERIDDSPPAGRLASIVTTDLTDSGRPDVIMGALGTDISHRYLPIQAAKKRLRDLRETNIFWYENPGWERHQLSTEGGLHLGVGGALGDITGNGDVDLVVGQGYGRGDVYWYEQPPDPREPWKRRLLTDTFQKYHDLAVGDVDDDGELEVVGASQEGKTVFYYDIPDEPTVEPWPEKYLTVVDPDLDIEGLEIVDIDGDGRTELIAGPSIYHPDDRNGESWRQEPVAPDWERSRLATGDLDGEGETELVIAEGDSPYLGTHPGRVAWFDPPDWEPHVLRDDLFCPHSLQVADFTGDGRLDIYTAEMGLGEHDEPRSFVFENTGDGEFTEHIIDRGVPTHEAKAVDLTGDGRPDIVSQSYEPDVHVDVWFNEN